MQVIGQDKLFAIYAGPIFAGGDSPANNIIPMQLFKQLQNI